jgi:hypothetical protein
MLEHHSRGSPQTSQDLSWSVIEKFNTTSQSGKDYLIPNHTDYPSNQLLLLQIPKRAAQQLHLELQVSTPAEDVAAPGTDMENALFTCSQMEC